MIPAGHGLEVINSAGKRVRYIAELEAPQPYWEARHRGSEPQLELAYDFGA